MAILYFFIIMFYTILHKKFQVILSKIEGVTAIFAIFNLILFFFQSYKFKVWTVGSAGP